MEHAVTHLHFATTTRGLRRDLPPMRLFEKAKRFGIWNPSDLDFSQDQADWARMRGDERDLVLRLTALFQAGEEAVTLDLLPLMQVIASEGRIEEEMFLTTFLWEEAKHTDFFSRFLTEVADVQGNLSQYHTASYRALFYEALPCAMGRLRTDSSPEAQAEASLTYNMIVEGVLAETGYHAFFSALERNNLLPGTRAGIRLLKQDESRHIAYGVYLLSRLIAENDTLWDLIEDRMNELVLHAMGVIDEAFQCYDVVPFGLSHDEFLGYAMGQFQKRLDRVERARGASLESVAATTQAAIDADDA
ncbi:MAG: R2-like ligand-binding oxidase [Roseiflexaceae bacterium]|nr:R2-like ligand-binding oxidase [Roseiflexaceae bacterium]